MHPNPIFRHAGDKQNIAFARQQAFGVLSVNADPMPLISHIPFQLNADGTRAEAHLVRSNPIARLLRDGPVGAVIAVQGPHGYISPDWYGIPDQVPTWNYVAVHLRGSLRVLPDADLLGVLERLSDTMETRLAPKPVWRIDKMDRQVRYKMMRMIVPVEMDVSRIDGTWKLSQNKQAAARLGAADGLDTAGAGMEATELARLMREPPA